MRSKKAGINFLGEKTVDIVIAVLVIVMLVFAGVKIYGMFSDKSETQKATDNVNNFAREFNGFINSSENSKDFIILGPKDWWIMAFSKSQEVSPKLCKDYAFCVCICKYNCEDELAGCAQIDTQINIGKGLGYEMKTIPYNFNLKKSNLEIK